MRIPLNTGLVAILRTKTQDSAREMTQELIKSGIKLIEFTTTTPAWSAAPGNSLVYGSLLIQ